jgi:hypothetical protein
MTIRLEDILAALPPHRRAKVDRHAERIMRRVRGLDTLREARALTQASLARRLRKQQPAISRIEKQSDMYVSTLRRYVRACGGRLDLVVRMPDGTHFTVERLGAIAGARRAR